MPSLLIAAGCAAVRDARLVQDPSSAIPGERTPTVAEIGLRTKGVLRLDDAVAAALRVNPVVVRARRDEESAAARVGAAEGAFLPQTSVNASIEQRETERNDGTGPAARSSQSSPKRFQSYGFSLSWLLFDFGRTPALSRQAAAQYLAAQSDERFAEVDVAHGVRDAYSTLVRNLRLVDVARDAVTQYEQHLGQAKEFVRVGTRIPYDETKAEVDLGNARLVLVQTENLVKLSQATLANAIGVAEVTDWTPEAPSAELPEPCAFETCWERARRLQPALAAAAAREDASNELVNAQIAALYPRVSLGAGLSQSGSLAPLTWGAQVGPSVSWVPFDGFQNEYSIDEAAAGLRAARAQRTLVEQQTWLEVRTAWLGIDDARRRLDLTGLLVRNAQEGLTLAKGRYEFEVGTAIELTDAQQALTQARAGEVQARADYDLALAALDRAIGVTGARPRSEAAAAGGMR